LKIWSIEGNTQKLDGGSMFGNAPKAVWQKWSDVDERNRIPLACRAMLIKDDGKNILFETGIGAFFDPKMRDRFGVQEAEHVLLNNLKQVGLSHEDIHVVVLSHLHFDHAGGLLSAWQEDQDPQLLFPNATYLVSQEGWARALKPHARDKASFIPTLNQQLEQSGRLEIVEGTHHATLGPNYSFHYSNGHTPGLMLVEVSTTEGPIVFGGDLIPGTPWVHVPITMGYDRYPELLIDEKERLLNDLEQRGGRLFFTHDPNIAMAQVIKDERGRFTIQDPKNTLRGLSLT
jgi:glyoxylase-like metal-dependent hydrolase (beta-lactamase superfamily II)